jgi:nucleoside 2-deoxyribosyltransferase
MSKLQLVYVAAPYTAHSASRRRLNVEVALHMGVLVSEAGASPFMPTVNSSEFCQLSKQDSWEFWMDATSRQLSTCDAIILCQGHHHSTGCRVEVIQATKMGIPIFYDIRDLETWLEDKREGVIK